MRFRRFNSLFPVPIQGHQMTFATDQEGKYGGVLTIFPQGSVKKFLSITTIGRDMLLTIHKNQNEDIITILNIYWHCKVTNKNTTRNLTNRINRIIRRVRSEYTNALCYVCGDLNLSSKTNPNLYIKLNTEMDKLGLTSLSSDELKTRYPRKIQALSQVPSAIDYIFGPENMADRTCPHVTDCSTMGTDHCMLSAGPIKRTRKMRKEFPFPDNRLKTDEGKEDIKNALRCKTGLYNIPEIDEKISKLTNIQCVFKELIEEITKEAHTKESKRKKFRKKQLAEYEEQIVRSWNKIQTPEVIQDRNELIHEKAIILDKIEAATNMNRKYNFLANSDKNSRYHFNRNNKRKLGGKVTTLRQPSGKLLTQPEDIEDQFHSHFSKKFRSQRDRHGPLDVNTHANDDLPKVDEFAALCTNGEISQNETEDGIMKLNDNSAPGPDGASALLTKFLYELVPKSFNALHNDMMNNGKEILNTRHMKLIPKPGKSSYTIINSYRPISLISCLIKSYENVLYQRLVTTVKLSTKCSMEDFVSGNVAYQKGKSVHDAFSLMDQLMEQYENDQEANDLVCACVDLDSAFDTVKIDYLVLLLRDTNFPKTIIDAIEKHYSSITISIKGQTTDNFPFTRGVPQGLSLSGLLFIIVSAVILRQISKLPSEKFTQIPRKDADFLTQIPRPRRQTNWPKMVGYSDDCNFFFKTSLETLEEVLKCYEKNTARSGLRISRQKTELYPLNAASLSAAEKLRSDYNATRPKEEHIKNEMTGKLKYLGHVTYPTQRSNKDILKSAGGAAIALCRKFNTVQRSTPYDGRCQIWPYQENARRLS